jgi:hypothetical protein
LHIGRSQRNEYKGIYFYQLDNNEARSKNITGTPLLLQHFVIYTYLQLKRDTIAWTKTATAINRRTAMHTG